MIIGDFEWYERDNGRVVGLRYVERKEEKDPFGIKKVIFNDPATIVLWADGTKTVVKCHEGDIYDKQTGLLMCMAKKMYGNNGKFNDILREWLPEDEYLYISDYDASTMNGIKSMIALLTGGKND